MTYQDQGLMLGRDRIFSFKVFAGAIPEAAFAMLAERVTRPLVTAVPPMMGGEPTFDIPVKHLHAIGGCEGALKIYPDRIVYESRTAPSESRFWRYADIQNFGQAARFRFAVTTYEDKFGGPQAYNFQLKEELPAGAYDYVWARVYPLKFRGREKGLSRTVSTSV